MREIRHAQDIYDLAKGGVTEIAYKLKVHPRTVERWSKFGIPESYWPKLHELYGVMPIQCFKLNERMKRYKTAA